MLLRRNGPGRVGPGRAGLGRNRAGNCEAVNYEPGTVVVASSITYNCQRRLPEGEIFGRACPCMVGYLVSCPSSLSLLREFGAEFGRHHCVIN
jgi:hypothetical protein